MLPPSLFFLHPMHKDGAGADVGMQAAHVITPTSLRKRGAYFYHRGRQSKPSRTSGIFMEPHLIRVCQEKTKRKKKNALQPSLSSFSIRQGFIFGKRNCGFSGFKELLQCCVTMKMIVKKTRVYRRQMDNTRKKIKGELV